MLGSRHGLIGYRMIEASSGQVEHLMAKGWLLWGSPFEYGDNRSGTTQLQAMILESDDSATSPEEDE